MKKDNMYIRKKTMADTYSRIYIHIVFAVQGRENCIREEIREELQKYIKGIITNEKQKLFAIYCMPDHVHLLVSFAPDIKISDLVRDIKANSSRFINEKKWIKGKFSWQQGFGGFSYSHSQVDTIVNYILHQPEHHNTKTFQTEYVDLLKKYEIQYEDRYLFEFLK